MSFSQPFFFLRFFVFLFLHLLSNEAFALVKPLSLQEVVLYALENSPTFDSAKKTKNIRELEYKNAFVKLLPSLDFSTSNGLQNASPSQLSNSTAPWQSTLSLGLTESLYDNGASFTNLNIASMNTELASLEYLKTRDNMVLEVIAEYYRFSLASVLLEVRKQQQEILEKQFKTLNNQYRQGFKTKSDFLRFKTQVQRAEIDRIEAENKIALSTAELRQLMGVKLDVQEELHFEPIQIEKNKKIELNFPEKPPAIENLYDYRIAKIQEKVNDKSITLAERRYWPQVFLTSGVTYSNQNYLNSATSFSSGNQFSWNALITLQYNLWDWGTRRRESAIAEFNRDIESNNLNQNLLSTNTKITGVMADLSKIRRSYQLSRELLSLEEESYQNLEAQYREGKVTYLDLITAVNNLLDAKVQFYTAYFDSLQTTAKYKYYEGKIYEETISKK